MSPGCIYVLLIVLYSYSAGTYIICICIYMCMYVCVYVCECVHAFSDSKILRTVNLKPI